MANSDWLNLLTAALGGGVTVKVLDIVYDAIRRHFESSKLGCDPEQRRRLGGVPVFVRRFAQCAGF
jgi:hypothetical protein